MFELMAVQAANDSISIASEHPEDVSSLFAWVISGLTAVVCLLITIIAKLLFNRLDRFEVLMRQDVSALRTHMQGMDNRLTSVETAMTLIKGEDRREFDLFKLREEHKDKD